MIKISKNNALLTIGKFLVILIALIIFISSLFAKYESLKKNTDPEDDTKKQLILDKLNTQSQGWREYKNEKYKISYQVPPLLHLNTIDNPKDYDLFVVHEENKYSKDKGVGFGVTKRSIDEEYEFIFSKLKEEDKGIEVTKKDINIGSTSGLMVNVRASEQYEDRSIIIIKNNNLTFSISTVPDQIGMIIQTSKFF